MHRLTMADKYKPPMLVDLLSTVTFLFCAVGISLLRKISLSGEEKFGDLEVRQRRREMCSVGEKSVSV